MEEKRVPGRDELIVRPGASPLTARVRVLDAGFGGTRAQQITKIVLRLLLGGLFVFGGWTKLAFQSDPTQFAFAIKGFKFGLPDHLVIDIAFMVPWTELFAGLCLIFGFFTRGAGLVIAVMMLAFIIGIASVIWRGLETHCGCFGSLNLFCDGPIGWCHIIRNTVLGAMGGYLAKVGAGPYSIDRIRARQHIPGYKLV
jgi:putative oxidoreductase